MTYTKQLPTSSFFASTGWETTLCKDVLCHNNYNQVTYTINILSVFTKIKNLIISSMGGVRDNGGLSTVSPGLRLRGSDSRSRIGWVNPGWDNKRTTHLQTTSN